MPAAIFDITRPAIDEINSLELRIIAAQGDADACLWRQAALVASQLNTMTQRALATQWINHRTGKPYAQSHVAFVAHAFEQHANQVPRPLFRDVYNAVAHRRRFEEPKPAEPVAAPEPLGIDRTRAGIATRRAQCRTMAGEGYTVAQIAEILGIDVKTVSGYARSEGYELTARRAGATHRHNANRIVEQMAMDAENLTADVNLIAFGELDQSRLPAWIAAFTESQVRLREFILKLKGAAT